MTPTEIYIALRAAVDTCKSGLVRGVPEEVVSDWATDTLGEITAAFERWAWAVRN